MYNLVSDGTYTQQIFLCDLIFIVLSISFLQIFAILYATLFQESHSKRASVFAAWILNTYGREFLSRGGGVIDVAGGKVCFCIHYHLSQSA